MEEFTNTKNISTDQHKSSSNPRFERDNIDINKLIYFFKEYNHFSNEKNLRNIATVDVANENFNVDQADEIGKNVLKLMENQTVAQFSFKSSWKSFSMAAKFKISSKHEEVLNHLNLLFQRLTAIEKNSKVSL